MKKKNRFVLGNKFYDYFYRFSRLCCSCLRRKSLQRMWMNRSFRLRFWLCVGVSSFWHVDFGTKLERLERSVPFLWLELLALYGKVLG